MAITIIHGANGGYKSSTIVQEHIIPAMEKGRVVVTNIRGVSLQRFYDAGVEVHSDSDVIYVDTDNTPEGKVGRDLMSVFWHWVPLNALLCFDESGVIFPKAWRDADLKKLPQLFESRANADLFLEHPIDQVDRPAGFIEAFEMHRHYGWDIVLSAPNIKSIRDDIRNTTELAWRHRNAALVGLKGRYKAVSHDPVNNGTVASNVLETKVSKIKQRTFDCYDSTKTGQATDTANASRSILGSPRLLLALAVSIGALYYAFSSGGFNYFTEGNHSTITQPSVGASASQGVSSVSLPISGQSSGTGLTVKVYGEPIQKLNIVGNMGDKYFFEGITPEGHQYKIDGSAIRESGYLMVAKSGCHVVLITAEGEESVYCKLGEVLSDEDYEEYLEKEIKYDDNSVSQVSFSE